MANNEEFNPSLNDSLVAGAGVLASQPDYRYIGAEQVLGAAPAVQTFPENFTIDFSGVPDLYQRKIGACTNFAPAEIRIHRETRLNGSKKTYAPRFTYALCKMEDGVPDLAPGVPNQATYVSQPFKTMVKYGSATETTIVEDTTLDYNTYIFNKDVNNIPAAAFTEADQNRIPGYVQVGSFMSVTEAQLKQAIMASQDGVVICLAVGSEWYTSQYGVVNPKGAGSWAAADILPIAKCVTELSGHAITAHSWETEAGTGRCKIFFRNHWSQAWANNDEGWLYLDEHPITEAWMISEIPDALLSIVKSLPAQKDFSYTWNTDLIPGETNIDVQNLQIALKIAGTFPFNQPVTQYFGAITKAAVIAFQKQHGVASPAEIAAAGGKVGPNTREALNKIYSHQ